MVESIMGFPRIFEDRIERFDRKKRNIRIDAPRSILFQDNDGTRLPPVGERPSNFDWRCDFFSETKYARTGVNTSVGFNSITVDVTDSGSGLFDGDNFEWTDNTKSWTVDEWVGFYLKVNGIYYQILSNTATVLTLRITRGTAVPNGAYTIIPFVPNSLTGLLINANTANDLTYAIKGNTESVITITSKSAVVGGTTAEISTGDSVAPYNMFAIDDLKGYADDFWNGFGIRFRDGANAGESQIITDYAATGGWFTTENFTLPISGNDRIEITEQIISTSIGATWRLVTGYIPGPEDFVGGNLLVRQVGVTDGGGISDSDYERPFIGRYASEMLAQSTKAFPLRLAFSGAISVYLVNVDTGRRSLLAEVAAQVNGDLDLQVVLESNQWHRLEIYLYVPPNINGIMKIVNTFGITPYINSWRDITAGPPIQLTVTGANSSNVNDPSTMLESSIVRTWRNDPFFSSGKTEIWISETENGTYTKAVTVESSQTTITGTWPAGTVSWAKLRHVSTSGVVGPYSDTRKGVVAGAGLGEAVVTLDWVDGGGSPVTPNENGWFNDTTLKAKITVSSSLTVAAIKFTRTGAGQVDLGDTSPATSAAVAEVADGVASVIVEFTNGLATESQSWNYRYDKTVPTALTFDVIVAKNSEVGVDITGGGVDSISGIDRRELYYNFTGSLVGTPDPLRTIKTDEFTIGFLKVNYGDIMYIWLRSIDNAGNISAWQSAGLVNLLSVESTYGQKIKSIVEFR
jgi:hypothetical protein